MSVLKIGIEAVERGLVPDALTRMAIRRLCRARLRDSRSESTISVLESQSRFIESMRSGPIAPVPHLANEQHYELPSDFFGEVLGSLRKYSCCYWADESTSLDAAEVAALAITCERAQIADGQDILELGCGWGSLSLWMAEQYPNSLVTAVSNSVAQRKFIEAAAKKQELRNLIVITSDMNSFSPLTSGQRVDSFDRVVSIAMFALWIIGNARRDASIVDPFWGAGFIIVGWLVLAWNTPVHPRVFLLAGLITLWGMRLSIFLLWRNWGHGEDHRYAAMRNRHGRRFWWISLLTVFLLQGLVLWFVSLPIQVAAAVDSANPLGWMDAIGALVWALGLFFETVGDWQLARFKANGANSGKVMDRGLWRYTRHPNYFGDFCVWWGVYLVAVAGGAGWTIGSPLLMSYLLMRVSGVTLLESTISDRRPGYVAYRARTNAFFPGPTNRA